MISLFTGASITSARAKNCSRTKWTARRQLHHPITEWGRWLEFGNYNNREWVLFIIYIDLECDLRKTKPNKEDASS